MTISVGGEIGEVGTQNSTVEELRAYLDGYRRELEERAPGAKGISKVSVQTGTSHGGVPLPDGGVAEVKLDFEVLRELGVVAREYGLAGAVQHGASTLPDELFHRFPAVETAEIHLATGFQNALYEHPAFPEALHREIEAWCFANAPTSASPARPTSSSCTRRARRHRAVQAPALGPRRPRTRSSPPSAARSRICSPSSGSTTRARWWSATSTRSRSTGRAGRSARGRRRRLRCSPASHRSYEYGPGHGCLTRARPVLSSPAGRRRVRVRRRPSRASACPPV